MESVLARTGCPSTAVLDAYLRDLRLVTNLRLIGLEIVIDGPLRKLKMKVATFGTGGGGPFHELGPFPIRNLVGQVLTLGSMTFSEHPTGFKAKKAVARFDP